MGWVALALFGLWVACVEPREPTDRRGARDGTMWKLGETFTDAVAGISVSVIAETIDGFEVTITSVIAPIFSDGFESGDAAAWSGSVP